MASKMAEEEEGKIPVFTVLKNNTILKNIFIVNKPPDEPSPSPSSTSQEDVLLVGRHPDCDLMLTHPSISRFHLQIRSTPSSQSLFVLDLSSVHGTWVSGRKVEPGVSMEMKEGDTLRIGVSSRIYRLHWIPITRAYDLENPFLSQLESVPEEEEQEAGPQEENGEDGKKDLKKCCPVEMEEIQTVDSILKHISPLFLDDNLEAAENEVPAAPPMPEDIVSYCWEEERKRLSKDETFGVLSNPFGAETSYLTPISDGENQLCDSLNQLLRVKEEIPSVPPMLEEIVSFCCKEEMHSQSRDETFGVSSSYVENNLCESINQVQSPPYVESVVECDNTWTEYLSDCKEINSFCKGEIESQSRDEPFGVPSSYAGNELCDSINHVQSPPYVESVVECDNTWTEYLSDRKEEIESQSRDEIFGVPSSYVENKLCDSINHVQSPPYVESVVECDSTWTEYLSDCICLPQEFYTPPDTITSASPTGIQDSFEKHWSSLLIDTDATSVDEKSAAEAVLPTEPQSKRTSRDNGRVSYILTAGVGVFKYEDTYLPVEEVIPDTSCQHIRVVEEVAVDSLSDEDYLNITKENENLQTDREILGSCVKAAAKSSRNGDIWSRRGKPSTAPQIRTSKSMLKDIANKNISENLFGVRDGEEDDEVFTPDKENFSPNTLQLRCLKNKGKLEEVEHSMSRRSHNSKDIFSSDVYPDAAISLTSSKGSPKDLFSVLDGENEDGLFTPDKENFSPNTLRLNLLKKKGKFSANTYLGENMSPTSNKENQTPKVAQAHKSRRKPFGSLVLAQRSQNSKSKSGANIYPDVGISPTSKKENPTPKEAKEHKPQRIPFGCHSELAKDPDIMALNNRSERVPFQLLTDAGGLSRSGSSCPVSAAKSINLSNCGDKHINPSAIIWEQKRNWDMVVDTATLMNKESRKALQLLKGLRGTRLIVPRLVLRELDSMNRQYSIFRRISEASLAIEWIEECMVKTNWWIHVQSSVEEEWLTALTPPASPHSQFTEESCTFPYEIESSQPSSLNYSVEIASPTVEDYILDFALQYRRRKNYGGQLVLLSEDVTLKIKCMAEGLLCETVQEFRESLVNPFSERFMWTNSSPRGQTWSCQDDAVLREKYCGLKPLMRKSSKGVAASGLKLILLHNSQYGH